MIKNALECLLASRLLPVFVRPSFILGIIGGIISILVGFIEFFLVALSQALIRKTLGLEYLIVISIIAGILGIIGGAKGRKSGGIIMIVGGVAALIGAGFFGILGLVLLVVGGILAIRDKYPPITT